MLCYNFYSDKLLGLDLVPQSVFDMQSDYYATIAGEYGALLDSRNTNAKSKNLT